MTFENHSNLLVLTEPNKAQSKEIIKNIQLKENDLVIKFDFEPFENKKYEIILNNLNLQISKNIAKYLSQNDIILTKNILKNFLKENFDQRYFLNLLTFLETEFKRPSCFFDEIMSIKETKVYSSFLRNLIDKHYQNIDLDDSDDIFDACSEEEDDLQVENANLNEITLENLDSSGNNNNNKDIDLNSNKEEKPENLFYEIKHIYLMDLFVDYIFDPYENNISQFFVSGQKEGNL